MIIVLGRAIVPAAQLTEALRLSREHVARSRTEPGCIEHGVYQEPDAEGHLLFVEKWESEAALKQHFRVPESIAFIQAINAIASEPPSLSMFTASELAF